MNFSRKRKRLMKAYEEYVKAVEDLATLKAQEYARPAQERDTASIADAARTVRIFQTAWEEIWDKYV